MIGAGLVIGEHLLQACQFGQKRALAWSTHQPRKLGMIARISTCLGSMVLSLFERVMLASLLPFSFESGYTLDCAMHMKSCLDYLFHIVGLHRILLVWKDGRMEGGLFSFHLCIFTFFVSSHLHAFSPLHKQAPFI